MAKADNHAFTITVDFQQKGSGEEAGSLLNEDIGVRWLLGPRFTRLQEAKITQGNTVITERL